MLIVIFYTKFDMTRHYYLYWNIEQTKKHWAFSQTYTCIVFNMFEQTESSSLNMFQSIKLLLFKVIQIT